MKEIKLIVVFVENVDGQFVGTFSLQIFIISSLYLFKSL